MSKTKERIYDVYATEELLGKPYTWLVDRHTGTSDAGAISNAKETYKQQRGVDSVPDNISWEVVISPKQLKPS
jgi:hypothetical protein